MEIILPLALVFLAIWVLYLEVRLKRTNNLFNKLSRLKGESLTASLKELIGRDKAIKSEFQEVFHELSDLETKSKEPIQKISLVNFSAFGDKEAAQSFSLALLDKYGSGIVITSMQSVGNSRVYAKRVLKGKGLVGLSPEEAKAVNEAYGQ